MFSPITIRYRLYSRIPVCRSTEHSRNPLTSRCGSPAAISIGSPSRTDAAARYERSFFNQQRLLFFVCYMLMPKRLILSTAA